MNNLSSDPNIVEVPLVMIEQFAARHCIPPEVISEIFCAGVVVLKVEGKLPDDACPILHYVRAAA